MSIKKSKMAFFGSGVADPNYGQTTNTPVGPYTSKKSKHKEAHGSSALSGMGDYYGRAMKNPMGRMRDSSSPGYRPVNKKQLGTPPTSVV